ncbi:Ribose-phosphate pyrophosphokinase [Planctomycetes bacterium Pan216]|uniref:Ribose-phosphate pyrophosphokinase n=1 Tax=Kolteria novifilia TaxID=2527975 RepID=A0A518B6J9_9BACT|nr:Ribose-phosphate pyrophosphokinase [Planctomycetes bacterium Pan216]
MHDRLKVFCGSANRPLARRICDYLGIELGKINIGRFPDNEISLKIEEDVRGRDVFLVQPTCPPVNEHIMELLIMIDSFRRASAQRITAVVPYYGYARQDRKDEGRVPITAKLVANLITEAGCDRVLCLDLHAAQIQGFFDVPVDHLYAVPVLHHYIEKLELDPDELAIVSPDEGRIKLALKLQRRLGGTLAVIDKRRSSATETDQVSIIGGPVDGKIAIMFDDMISTGGSVVGAARVLHASGARDIRVCVTHGLFCNNALERMRQSPLVQIVATDSVPLPNAENHEGFLTQLSVAPLLGEAIKRIHRNESVSFLFNTKISER